ncbi:lactaldehyde dehydrogenase/glycolaldehyde dehydrogenase [Variovorax paradoxus]|uniref:Lactaldehyde dehydrogenase/glycolaldehyde dehydrogenase n=1 Tax=Variovorax paradoxus TaxID=34073 RepID=A0AAW8E887_VARPD|nr:aldehyde dehydrogenase [Variovorax paradoxus]MDP9968985.1 lactaldehyde dehydrogenase/glycolaldehyde dehydrogenase [Variovorax paradoxus]
MTKDYHNFINGTFGKQASTALLEVLNPATNETIGHVPNSSRAEVDAAVAAAKEAQTGWERLPPIHRAGYLRKISKKVRDNKERLAELITREQGKVLGLAQVEVDFTADYIDYMAEWARRIEGEVITSDRPNETILLLRKAVGVIAGILPWNFPFFLIARKLAPALVAGNTIVIKPSEETPLNAFAFAELVAECDLPPGVFNLVGGSRETGAALAGHRDVNLVSFTGSVGTGVHIMRAAAENLTRVNLELGGKAPAIVLASADLNLAANAVYQSRILNSGQVCNCAERVYVERPVLQAFTDKVVALMKSTTYGDPLKDRSVSMGPLVSAAQLAKVASAVELARTQGAQLALGGKIADRGGGNHYEPTVLVDCNHDMEIMRTETFGPVLPIQAIDSLDEGIRYANDSEYGLTSSIFSNDLNAVMHACRELKFGETYVNREHFEAMQGFHAGRRKSGIGGADGKHGLYEYMETQVVYLQTK